MSLCLLCRASAVEPVLALGPQPVSTHFATRRDIVAVEHQLDLGMCRACGVVQLCNPFPYEMLVPPFDWLTYREPERHLDAVVAKVAALPGIDRTATIAGVTVKDHTTLSRFARLGFEQTWCVDVHADLGATDPRANVETVQALLTPEKANEIIARRGLVDVLIVRHIVEHAQAPWRFLAALGALLRDGGYMVVEVPDCAANLERQDYAMIWEEHTLYFTPQTLAQVMPAAGCESLGIDIHPYLFEDCLIQIGRKTGTASRPVAVAARETDRLSGYVDAFPHWTQSYRAFLESHAGAGRGAALYGAGHLACAFVNFHGLADLFRFVVDDTPQKQGLFLPKCGLPIVPRETLDANGVPVCLFGLSPEVEDKIIANNLSYIAAGGRFYSILAASERSLRKALS
jgi:C-methyltransferase C-terminal domain/Putative zinc binding domain/Methyltransferase domain